VGDLAPDAAGDRAGTPAPGRLTIADRAVRRIAEMAARVEGTTCTHGGVRGRTLPRADVTVRGGWARVAVDVALAWPAPASATAERVREAVARDLDRYVGMSSHVDVHVVTVADATRTVERVR
jgi:uncharacterized alkaline shock family protein YloU